jgi:tetratricopeptide (TPR) repeat protein
MVLPPEGHAPSHDLALSALIEFGLKLAKRLEGRPARVEVRDLALRDALAGPLAQLATTVTVVDEMRALREVLGNLEAEASGGERIPGLLDAEGVTVDHVRAFADAAAAFFGARPWMHLANEDLIVIDGPDAPRTMRHVCVLGQGGEQFGIAFFDSRRAFEQVLESADTGRPPTRAHGATFGPIDELPFGDVDAWLDHDLPVAGPRAYPVLADLHRDGIRRPDLRELVHATALLRALAETSEDELDAGRWQKRVPGPDGVVELTLSLPELLEAQAEHESENGAGRELTPLERAQELAYEAMEAEGRLKIKLARQALAVSPDCADAWVALGDAASTPEAARECYGHGVAAGERAIGADAFAEMTGQFWGHLETRPYMRARLGLADVLSDLGEMDEAIVHYREMLRLNPNDNLGVRYLLMTAVLNLGRNDEALALIEQYPEDIGAFWPYARLLVRYRLEGESAGARDALDAGIAANPHVVSYLLKPDSMPFGRPSHYTLGSREEAVIVAEDLGRAYADAPGLFEWLASRRPRTRTSKRTPAKPLQRPRRS